MQPDPGTATPEQVTQVLNQHVAIQTQLNFLQVEFVLLIGLVLLLICVMTVAAAWSVQTVNNKQAKMESEFTQLVKLIPQLIAASRRDRQ